MPRRGLAVYVISQEDIHRSGMTNTPDLQRTAPGVDVAQIDANTYAISIRGFNDRLASKVLVMIDGRTVYTPTTSGGSIVGQNLLRPRHAEFHNAYEVRRTLVERSVFARITWHF